MAEPGRFDDDSPLELGAPSVRGRFGFRRQIPFVQQTAATDCGAACLTMVLRYRGKNVRLDEVREITGFGRDGSTAVSLVRAGKWFGLRGRGVKVEKVRDIELLPRGAILHWRFVHFAVLERATSRGIDIVDPAVGRRRVGWEEVGRSFTGAALLFEPREDFEAGGRKSNVAWVYARKVLTHSGVLSRVLITSGLLQVLALMVPLLIGVLVDRVVPMADYNLLTLLGLGLLAMTGFYFVSALVRSHLLLYLRTRLDVQLTLDFVNHLVDLPYSFFEKRSAGDLVMRLNSNATVREFLTTGALSGALDGVLVSFYLVVLFASHTSMGLLVLSLGLVRVVLFLFTRKKHRDLMSESLQAEAESQNYQIEIMAGMETLKASGAEHDAVEHWSNLFVNVLNVSLARGRLSAWVESLLQGLAMASPLVILLLGGHLVLQGELSLGMMLALNALAAGFLEPLTALVTTAFQLQLMGSYMDRIADVLETPKEQEGRSVRPAPRLAGKITMEGVRFQYGPVAPYVVDGVSLEIRPGELVSIVGKSGAGKSTLASLLLGLHLPSEGTIRFDDVDMEDLDLKSLRRQLKSVPQHPYLFGATIRSNITLGNPHLSHRSVVEAAKAAQLHEDIESMAMGYDTVLADGGASLSGGQRQRLALARALIDRPGILLLDEATSAVDEVTEASIYQELEKLRCTRIVIAHRLSTIRHADLILVMDGGRIVERGRHDELLELKGLYHRLVSAHGSDLSPPDADPLGGSGARVVYE